MAAVDVLAVNEAEQSNRIGAILSDQLNVSGAQRKARDDRNNADCVNPEAHRRELRGDGDRVGGWRSQPLSTRRAVRDEGIALTGRDGRVIIVRNYHRRGAMMNVMEMMVAMPQVGIGGGPPGKWR